MKLFGFSLKKKSQSQSKENSGSRSTEANGSRNASSGSIRSPASPSVQEDEECRFNFKPLNHMADASPSANLGHGLQHSPNGLPQSYPASSSRVSSPRTLQPHGSNIDLPPSGTQLINRRAIFSDSEQTDLNSCDTQVAAYHPNGNGLISAPHPGHERSPFSSKRAALQAFPDLATTQSSGRSPMRTLTMAPLRSHAQGSELLKSSVSNGWVAEEGALLTRQQSEPIGFTWRHDEETYSDICESQSPTPASQSPHHTEYWTDNNSRVSPVDLSGASTPQRSPRGHYHTTPFSPVQELHPLPAPPPNYRNLLRPNRSTANVIPSSLYSQRLPTPPASPSRPNNPQASNISNHVRLSQDSRQKLGEASRPNSTRLFDRRQEQGGRYGAERRLTPEEMPSFELPILSSQVNVGQRSPLLSPYQSPPLSPHWSPHISPQRSPVTSPRQPSPHQSPQRSPVPPSPSRRTSQRSSFLSPHELSPHRSVAQTPRRSPQLSPIMSPPQRSPPHSPSRQQAMWHGQSSQQSPPHLSSPIPQIPKRWSKGQVLGKGSFGTVYEAWNLDDGSFFAVKVSDNETIAPEIQQEVAMLSKLRHPNIVQYFGTSMEDGCLCIFLELVKMGSLQSIMKKYHHFNEILISTYTRQILKGLEYLHGKNTVHRPSKALKKWKDVHFGHRDIKCANLLVDCSGQVKLADFGLAKQMNRSLATSFKGTPFYMAPEVMKPAKNNRSYGLAVDIWSLGCTVLEMAQGKPPWSELPGFAFFFKVSKGELPPIPKHLSVEAQDFILQCLRLKPEERPTARQLLQHPFVANAPPTFEVAASVSGTNCEKIFNQRRREMPQQSYDPGANSTVDTGLSNVPRSNGSSSSSSQEGDEDWTQLEATGDAMMNLRLDPASNSMNILRRQSNSVVNQPRY